MPAVKLKGFTLIELMIALVITGILALIAYPSYVEYINRGRRADAKQALLEYAAVLERFYTENNRYTTTTNSTTIFEPVSAQVPASSTTPYYTISAVNLVGTNNPRPSEISLRATPAGLMANDRCGTLTFSLTEQTGLINADTESTVNNCWQR